MAQKRKNQSNQASVQEQPMTSSVTGQVRSGFNSARQTASNHKTLGGVIGVGAALATYFLGTAHGRSVQGKIGESLKSSFCTVRDSAVTGWERLRDFANSQLETTAASSETEQGEGFHITEINQHERPRRVV